MGGFIKKIVLACIGGLAAFFILEKFFRAEAYYPYNFTVESQSNALTFININLLNEKIKNTFDDGRQGVYYVDSAIKTGQRTLQFAGRFYSKAPVDEIEIRRLVKNALATEVSIHVSENVCAKAISGIGGNLAEQLKTLNSEASACMDRVRNELEHEFALSSASIVEGERIKKIQFICLIVSLFFGGAIFVILENWNRRKDE